MKTARRNYPWRATVLGLLCASLGFTWALATSGHAESRGLGADSRAVGTGCSRLPTEFYTNTDLGIVVVGSQLTRQILVRFGFRPHLFAFGTQVPASGLTLSSNGTLMGQKTGAGTETFEITVTDSTGGEDPPVIAKTFTITGVPYVDVRNDLVPLHFANVVPPGTPVFALPNALANEPYSFSLHANGGWPQYRFGFVSDADFGSFPPGLSLNALGGIYGKPSTPGLYTFKLFLRDGNRTRVEQTFSITVGVGTITSDFVATSGKFKLNFGREGTKDSLSLSVILNKADLAARGIRRTEDLEHVQFLMQFGGASVPPLIVGVDEEGELTGEAFPSEFDKRGSIRFPAPVRGVAAAPGEDLRYDIKLNPRTGLLKVRCANLNLISRLGAQFNTFVDPIIPVNVLIGESAANLIAGVLEDAGLEDTTTETAATDINFDKTDIIKFLYTRRGAIGVGTGRTNDLKPPGGFFLITKAEGAERTKGPRIGRFDRLTFRMSGLLRQPNGAAIRPVASDTVGVLLGQTCLATFSASNFSGSGDVLIFSNSVDTIPLKSLIIDNQKGVFSLETFPIDPRLIFGQDALEAGIPFSVPLTMTIRTEGKPDPTFDGQATVTLFRKGNRLINK